MKPLNRPMFRYGGPIKEGIMTGMQDRPGYSIGGLLSGAGTALMTGLRASPQFAKNIFQGFRSGKYISPFDSGITKTQRFRNLFPTGKFRQTKPIITRSNKPTIDTKGADYSPITIKPGQNLGFKDVIKDPKRIGAAIAENPILALSTPSLATSATQIGGPVAIDTLKGIANFLVPGTSIDPFGPKKDLKTTEGGSGVKRGDPNKNKNVASTDTGGTNNKSNAEKQIINEDRINETKQKYYKLMGIDKMNKDAVYDSLINASQIVSEEGADLKGAIRSGTLQNRIIQAIGKNLDKSADLKKAIDSAVLKGEIQKDINLTKPSAFAEQVEYIRNNPNDPLAKKLSGMTSVADNLAALADKPITSDMVARLVTAKGTEIEDIVKDDKYQKWEKNNEGKDEIDYLAEITEGKTLDAGIYIVNKKAIRIDEEGSAFPVDLDSIIG
jgi:hypothetical protein|tara:strand:+ start:5694 stop:7016 length:1323 start_codon:yes stop_codon:yes gene_type:complete